MYEALRLPLTHFVARLFRPGGYFLSHGVVLETLKNLTESASLAELKAVHAQLPEDVPADDGNYHAIIVGLKADLQKRIESPLRLATFLGIYRPIFRTTRTRCHILAMRDFPIELFHLIVELVLAPSPSDDDGNQLDEM